MKVSIQRKNRPSESIDLKVIILFLQEITEVVDIKIYTKLIPGSFLTVITIISE